MAILNLITQASHDQPQHPEPCDVNARITVETLASRSRQQMTWQQQTDMQLYLYSIKAGETGKDWVKYAQQSVASTILQVQVEDNFISQFLSANMVPDA